MNYRFSYLCKDFFATREMSVSEFDQQMQKMMMRYPRAVSLVQMNFLDSHDVPRFLTHCNGDRKRMELAFFYLMMGVGVPSVFYGDEYYIEGLSEPEYRRAMPWGQQESCYEKLKLWIRIRKEHTALQNGRYSTVFCEDDKNVYGFKRRNQEEELLVIVNNSEEDYYYHVGEKMVSLTEHAAYDVGEKVFVPAMHGGVYQIKLGK